MPPSISNCPITTRILRRYIKHLIQHRYNDANHNVIKRTWLRGKSGVIPRQNSSTASQIKRRKRKKAKKKKPQTDHFETWDSFFFLFIAFPSALCMCVVCFGGSEKDWWYYSTFVLRFDEWLRRFFCLFFEYIADESEAKTKTGA